MGLDTTCSVTLNERTSTGKAHCGDGEIDFRGDFRFLWKWSDLSSVEAYDGQLVVRKGDQQATFELGDASTKWQHAILNPKTRIDKSGLKHGQSYAAWGVFDDTFADELISKIGPERTGILDCIFVRLDSLDDLPKLVEARSQIEKSGMIWAVWPKGRKELTETHVRAFGLENGLVDVKVMSFSPVLSALKLVIPVKDR